MNAAAGLNVRAIRELAWKVHRRRWDPPTDGEPCSGPNQDDIDEAIRLLKAAPILGKQSAPRPVTAVVDLGLGVENRNTK